jgi:hypothetical protein
VSANPRALQFGIEASMNTPRPERRRLQFGLRKLLLWTAVAALVLGWATTFRQEEAWVIACWILTFGVVRVAFGFWVAGILSIGAGAIFGGWLGYIAATRFNPNIGLDLFKHYVVVGCVSGFILFGVVELIVRVVEWADNLMRTKSDD